MVYRQPDKDELFTEENRRVMDRAECILCQKNRFVKAMKNGICTVCIREGEEMGIQYQGEGPQHNELAAILGICGATLVFLWVLTLIARLF